MLFKNLCGILKRRTVSINLIEICLKPFLNLWWMTSCYILKVRQDKLVGFSNLSRYPAKEVAKYVVELLPVLCEHLEATSGFFQVIVLTFWLAVFGMLGMDVEQRKHLCSPQGIEPHNLPSSEKKNLKSRSLEM